MIVVSDTSPINYLLLIGEIGLLNLLYQSVLIPNAVFEELSDPQAPMIVQKWAAALPEWVRVRDPLELHPALSPHDRGEVAAISLALEVHPDLLLIDEKRGRQIAMGLGLAVAGLVGLLTEAGIRKLVDIDSVLHRLKRETSFRMSIDVQNRAIEQVRRALEKK